uniref:tRNA-specific 2-thiouridylase MnmA-like C-terminal domain-containing protein n=1 Tax=Solanum lycopersicum TaxID=4081 RepID=A0A3Q7I4X8_SOLLC
MVLLPPSEVKWLSPVGATGPDDIDSGVSVVRYVVEKDIKNNVVYVSRNYFSVDKKRRLFRVGSLKWLSGLFPKQIDELQCKVRHGPGFYNCSLVMEVDQHGQEVAVVRLSGDDQGLAAGQFAAFYDGRTCIGSGIILESWDDQGYPICERALEIARMEDKSKLGKPVKIMCWILALELFVRSR